jgi:hypothetical protein
MIDIISSKAQTMKQVLFRQGSLQDVGAVEMVT